MVNKAKGAPKDNPYPLLSQNLGESGGEKVPCKAILKQSPDDERGFPPGKRHTFSFCRLLPLMPRLPAARASRPTTILLYAGNRSRIGTQTERSS